MQQKRFWLAALIIALLIIVGFALSIPHAKDGPQAAQSELAATSTPAHVIFHDAYAKGVHTFTGTLAVPDACTSVTAEATTTGPTASSTEILLSISAPETTGICLEVPQTAEFKASVSAPEEAPVRVEVNGVLASTTKS